MSLLVPIPAPAVQYPQATIVWPRNPFHPADKDLYPVQPGSTIADWMYSQSITDFPLPTVCLVNGQPLLRRDWAIRPLAAHDVVVLVGLPGGGGGGGGSNPLRVVLSIAVMVLAPYAAAGLMGYGMTAAGIAAAQAAMGTIGFGLLAAGVSVLGAYLVNALVPLPSANVPSAQNALAPSPSAYSQQEVISGATPDTIRRSYRYPVTPGRYEVKVVRLDHKDTRARAGHELRWGEVRGYLVNPSLPAGITFLAVKMRATDNLSMRSSRLINCLVTRKLPTWSPSSGWSSSQATRSIAWAFADAVRASYGAKLADSRIDLPALYRLDQTWNQRGDQFDAVFDQKVTVWEALTRIARCGRAVPYLQSGVVRLVRDEPKTLPVGRFTTANIVKGSFKLQYVMPGEETADAVTVEFFSPKTWKPAEVTVSLPGSTQTNPATVNLFGCTNQTQAMREGKYIAAANRYRRRLITFRTETEGLIPTFGDLIAISHDMPAQGTEGNSGSSTAGESADIPWSQLARVMAIRPRGEQVEIACVVEHPLVHTADQ